MQRLKGLYRFDRKPMDKHYLEGFVVDYTDDLVLLHVMTGEIFLNGYSVIRGKDIKRYRPYRDFNSFPEKALAKRKQTPTKPKSVDLSSIAATILSANRDFPLITIHQEKKDSSVCHIGSMCAATEKAITMNLIDSDAEFERKKIFQFTDITKVDFGGAYEEALWLVASAKTKAKLKARE